MRIHILGIAGTFMAGIARLAKAAGHDVEGSDANIYPPMSTQLEELNIKLYNGFSAENIHSNVDCVIVGNIVKRGNPAMESVMERKLPYVSGPEWLADHILRSRTVLAVAGTHGKTTTASLLAWALEYAGKSPGFLIGGVPENFGVSARMGEGPCFVVEADEYDSAFFDKRPKFIHYRPAVALLNNLEFDHADIYPDLSAIQQQFHYLIRTVPGNGLIIHHARDPHLQDVLAKGHWSPLSSFDGETADWQAQLLNSEGSHFTVSHKNAPMGEVKWGLIGRHNINNALAVLAATTQVGVPVSVALEAFSHFKSVKRRLEIRGEKKGILVYDDFAHHPTAIRTTLAGLRAKVGRSRIIVVLEFGSYTMRSGVHKSSMKTALTDADMIFCKKPAVDWGLDTVLGEFEQPTALLDEVDDIVKNLSTTLKVGDHVVVMSNSGFDGIHQKLLNAL